MLPILVLLLGLSNVLAQPQSESGGGAHSTAGVSTYVLGPDDQITVRVMDTDEIGDKPFRVDIAGNIRLPLVGRVHAAGLSVEQLEGEISKRLTAFLLHPDVSISVTEFRSQPVSVIGAVRSPGVHQVQGRKSLVEMLSLAGGLDATAGSTLKITRRLECGRIPLPGATDDPSGKFSIAQVSLQSLLQAEKPEENISISPNDIISVPPAEMVYVIGEVPKPGGFAMKDREGITVLQAVSMAGGLDRTAAAHNARILRPTPKGERAEIPINLKKILDGDAADVSMQAADILFVPGSKPKKAALRAAEAAIQLGTGIAVFHR